VKENEGKFDFLVLVVSLDLRARLLPLFYKCGGWFALLVETHVINFSLFELIGLVMVYCQ
jgi:hypothetical protein